ncbi:NADH-cytochrome b5 reductase 1 [Cyclospora cayetanensis]|uniref:NADH-cytochrome b5 reductase n=1 Tax=Cyclospora cayetanensis TaxID=88456 RepID=A0A1D3D179_9EIME|nr:NADH-cytochrome b5 reductase 1 [Cyclospora cayetanensis]
MKDLSLDLSLMVAVVVVAACLAAGGAVIWQLLRPKHVEPFLCRERKQMRLVDKTEVSPDTYRFLFALQDPNQPLGLPVGQHLKVFGPNVPGVVPGEWNGKPDLESSAKEISRKYSPVSSSTARGTVELVVKVYSKQQVPPFLDGGKMSQFLQTLQIGDKIDVQGPFGKAKYNGRGSFSLASRVTSKKKVGLLAGGTGITPIFQLIRRVLEDHADPTQLFLVYANKREEDILLRDEIEELENEYPDRLSVWYTLEFPPAGWKYSSGFISKEMIQGHLPPPSVDTLVMCCGPRAMIENACLRNLAEVGYDREDIFCF